MTGNLRDLNPDERVVWFHKALYARWYVKEPAIVIRKTPTGRYTICIVKTGDTRTVGRSALLLQDGAS